jgi:hypothetical protein
MAVKTGWEVDKNLYWESGATFLAWSGHGWLGDDVYGSYGINGWVENNECIGEPKHIGQRRWRHSAVRGAGNIPLLLDAPWIDCWPMDDDEPAAFDDQGWQQGSHMARFMKNRHEGGIQGVFVDYSVRWIGLKEMYTLKWHREFEIANEYTLAGGGGTGLWPEWMKKFKAF